MMNLFNFLKKNVLFTGFTFLFFSLTQTHALYVDLPTNNFKYIQPDINLDISTISKGPVTVNSTETFDIFNHELKAFTSLTAVIIQLESISVSAEGKGDCFGSLPPSLRDLIDSSVLV